VLYWARPRAEVLNLRLIQFRSDEGSRAKYRYDSSTLKRRPPMISCKEGDERESDDGGTDMPRDERDPAQC
jgi:hypothetical protein